MQTPPQATSCWPELQRTIAARGQNIVVLPVSDVAGESELNALRVTTKSALGAIARHTGGILIDSCWLRLLGAGGDRLPRTISSWTRQAGYWNDPTASPSALVVADDVLGGTFAINGGAFGPKALGKVHYLDPRSLAWTNLDVEHSQFVTWALTRDLQTFYGDLRWSGWEREAEAVDGSHAISVYPFLWTTEGRYPASCARSVVPVQEVVRVYLDSLNNK